MTPDEQRLLQRAMDGALSPAEQDRLDASPALRRALARRQRLRSFVAEGSRDQDAFDPFFADRVMRRLAAPAASQDEFAASLLWLFRRVALVALLLAMALATYNVIDQPELSYELSPIEAAFRVPPYTLEAAYVMEATPPYDADESL